MAKIDAFIGHSFTDDDAEVVQKFIEYFDQLKESGIGFDWTRARAAEPRELASKVLNLIQGKNLFIGLCTKKERGIADQALQRSWLDRNALKAEASAFSWKTSDWIIQEIGLAVGRGMNLMLLVEKGVRPPGGLQGNIEYIEFERTMPERSFGRILEMLRALSPQVVSANPMEGGTVGPETEAAEPTDAVSDWLTPRPGWRRKDYELALMHMIAVGDSAGEAEIFDAYMASLQGAAKGSGEGWEACREYYRMSFGQGGKLARLEELASVYPDNNDVHRYLAKGYAEFGEQEKAAVEFERAAQLAGSPRAQASGYADAAIAFWKAGAKAEASKMLKRMTDLPDSSKGAKAVVVGALREMASLENDNDAYFGFSELLLELRPDEMRVRFDVAYKYSEEDHDKLSLFHYLRIPASNRSASAWNNLGVQYEHLRLSSKAVTAYRIAEKHGETLAMSNLAQKLLYAGFLEEAEAVCERALSIKGYHKNIGSAIAKIKELPEEENKKEQELVEESSVYSGFYRAYGRALKSADVLHDDGIWQGPKCRLRIEMRDGSFGAEGQYERNVGFGLGLALGMAHETSRGAPVRRRITYEGKLSGRGVKGSLKDVDLSAGVEAARNTLLSSAEGTEVLMVISESLSEIWVHEKAASAMGKLYKLTRLQERDEAAPDLGDKKAST